MLLTTEEDTSPSEYTVTNLCSDTVINKHYKMQQGKKQPYKLVVGFYQEPIWHTLTQGFPDKFSYIFNTSINVTIYR